MTGAFFAEAGVIAMPSGTVCPTLTSILLFWRVTDVTVCPLSTGSSIMPSSKKLHDATSSDTRINADINRLGLCVMRVLPVVSLNLE